MRLLCSPLCSSGSSRRKPESLCTLITAILRRSYCIHRGVTDACNPSEERFTKQRLWDLLETSPRSTAVEFLDNVEERVRQHTASADQFDDMTMLAIKRKMETPDFVERVFQPNLHIFPIVFSQNHPNIGIEYAYT
ncbi:hypothetical protein CSA56_04650 [candidate division KSB3 bacterium]|uniref:PPM-type phosphatase domain-containing protein n=1 Tax=candidate division KSB3 bacterium TaxID=2044937 RepID=A0A2G6KKG8_9BACT|nr:MAG: hypothetical protein CSA56_04650 [candidate division KSB3 bacterium]